MAVLNRKHRGISVVKVLLTIFFLTTVFIPLLMMFGKIEWSTISNYIFTEQFTKIVIDTMTVTICATVISVLVAYVLALAINRSRLKSKSITYILVTLPMLIPSVSHGMGLVNLFGDNGLFTKLFHINIGLYGFKGILIGSVMYSFPVAFLMLSDAMKYADGSIYEAADVMGIPKVNRFFAVTMQYMKRPLISCVFAVFTMIFTDYGVALSVGGRYTTLPLYLYREVVGLFDFSKGAFLGMLLLIPAIIAFIIDLRKNDDDNQGFVTKTYHVKNNKLRDIVLGVFTYAVIGFVLLVMSSFVIMTFVTKYPYDLSFSLQHVQNVFGKGLTEFIKNSFVIALFTSILGTSIGFITAYITARTEYKLSTKVLHLISISSLAIPGIVLGLGYVICFSGTFLYGTIAILVFVNIIHFFSSPYLMMYNAMNKLNANYENVATTLNISKFALIKDVFIPNTLDTITEMFGYFFVNCMVTISAVAFLYNSSTKPLSILINEYESSMALEAAAFVSVMILLTNIVMKGIIALVKRYCKKQYSK